MAQTKERQAAYYAANREKIAAQQKAWREKNKRHLASYRLNLKYGLSADDYDRMLEEQGGGCSICFAAPTSKRLAVDHDHATGAVRALLCDTCNRAIGLLGDDADLLRSAASYLDRFKEEGN